MTAALERLDKLVEATPKDLDQTERAKRFEDLKHQRELASIALGEFQTKLVRDHDELAGEVARLNEIQAALPADAALVAWVDIPPAGPNAADPDGEHWGVVVRSRGIPAWIPIAGTGPGRAVDQRRHRARRPSPNGAAAPARRRRGRSAAPGREITQPSASSRLAKALGASSDGQPPARRLIVLPSRAMAGIPIEALLAPGRHPNCELCTIGHRVQVPARAAPARSPCRFARSWRPGLRAPRHVERAQAAARPWPAGQRGDARLQRRDPWPQTGRCLAGLQRQALNKKDDLKTVTEGDKPIAVEIWREGHSSRRDLAPGKLGVVIDPRPAREAIAANRAMNKVLVAARGGDEDFAPLPGTRYEVEALARLFQSDDRPTRILLGADASEPELDRLAASGELGRFGFIHLATHGVIDEAIPDPLGGDPDPDRLARSARAGAAPEAGLRRPAVGPRDPARLGTEGRAGNAFGLRDGAWAVMLAARDLWGSPRPS